MWHGLAGGRLPAEAVLTAGLCKAAFTCCSAHPLTHPATHSPLPAGLTWCRTRCRCAARTRAGPACGRCPPGDSPMKRQGSGRMLWTPGEGFGFDFGPKIKNRCWGFMQGPQMQGGQSHDASLPTPRGIPAPGCTTCLHLTSSAWHPPAAALCTTAAPTAACAPGVGWDVGGGWCCDGHA